MPLDDPPPEIRRRYLERTTPSAEAVGRLTATVRQAVGSPGRPRRLPWVLATVVLLGIVWVVGSSRSPQEGPLNLPIDHVTLDIEGTGTVTGTPEAPMIAWSEGRVEIAVEPDRGVALSVVTDEAEVRVIGTRFDVERLHHATRIQVYQGRVRVTCASEDPMELGPGQDARCLPADLPGLLRRAAALTQADADPAERLQTLDRAEARAPPDGPAAEELLAHRVRAHADAGDPDQALAFARRYIASGFPTRRPELLVYAARTGFEQEACAARPDLERAVAEGPSGIPRLLLARCVIDEDPDRARTLVQAAATTPEVLGSPDWSRVAEALLTALPP